ncbi:histone H2A.Z-specific chaperone CHZ1-like [Dioscorea cayenensis subsp. rotundata]|uniref:Histone H2A.Z-specific chaperone CHZ1-like n=1 Tax=Dioscorea cayennensis subsp. rotundata TaxID=55577 RepID=A0AB40BAN0_DIOCR|nr:histone H2A.Z-specific chaperone CHZ1-like [Dioscorea cayenensis subsp. rotundata]
MAQPIFTVDLRCLVIGSVIEIEKSSSPDFQTLALLSSSPPPAMAENGSEPQALAPSDPPDHSAKRKPDPDCAVESEANRKSKLLKPLEGEDNGEEEEEANKKEKGVITAVDKGKGKMVVEDEQVDGDDEDSSSDDVSNGGVDGGDEDGSDFDDDPLAEVDLDNILPSRTRRRVPPPPGAYLVVDQDEDEEDDEDEDGEE